jgi:ABC-type dipeptide/oligopeptide/nickel transport system permease subunit
MHPRRKSSSTLRPVRSVGLLILVAYLVVGAFVAATSGYFQGLGEIENILSAILAILLWPLVLLDVNLNIRE